MAASVSATSSVAAGGNKTFANNSTGQLDTVLKKDNNESGVAKRNSLAKIASFRPTQLKNFNSKIQTSVAQRKEASQARQAEQEITKNKVKEIKGANPISQKNPVEAQTGSKIDLKT